MKISNRCRWIYISCIAISITVFIGVCIIICNGSSDDGKGMVLVDIATGIVSACICICSASSRSSWGIAILSNWKIS